MLVPLLTEADPSAKGEGSIDPLGTYSIADALATRLAPGVRERQAHPRFLTAMAVSYAVCGGFDETVVAKDDESEPWLVFEWYLVEGLVRRLTDPGAFQGGRSIVSTRGSVTAEEDHGSTWPRKSPAS